MRELLIDRFQYYEDTFKLAKRENAIPDSYTLYQWVEFCQKEEIINALVCIGTIQGLKS